jgi:hypothetical protein
MTNSATEATTQDALVSIEEEGDGDILLESGLRSLLQTAQDLTTHARVRAARRFALRQNARVAVLPKFHSLQWPDHEIDRAALKCQPIIGCAGFASSAHCLYEWCQPAAKLTPCGDA